MRIRNLTKLLLGAALALGLVIDDAKAERMGLENLEADYLDPAVGCRWLP